MSIPAWRSERFWRSLHFYLGLLLCVQLVAWFASGVVMSWFPIAEVRGEHLHRPAPSARWSDAAVTPASVLQGAPADFKQAQLSLSQRGDEPVYQLQQDNQQLFISALSGKVLTQLSAGEVQSLALQRYQGQGLIQNAPNLSNDQLAQRRCSDFRGASFKEWGANLLLNFLDGDRQRRLTDMADIRRFTKVSGFIQSADIAHFS